jgi:hypothetical protein
LKWLSPDSLLDLAAVDLAGREGFLVPARGASLCGRLADDTRRTVTDGFFVSVLVREADN